ncbi:FecR domain-containing protein [Sorangium sp. So ce131]|uniref:FecR domain-containing protein n=1 Tax=Sorangium sp. So ce131 TaxID=3133282 RepID=UPI003F63F145
MSGAKQYDRAREHMERLLRAEQPPEPCWDSIERELFARIERERPAPVHRAAPGDGRGRRAPLGRALLVAAVAAALALAVTLVVRRPAAPVETASTAPRARDLAEMPAAPGSAGARGDLDHRALRPGDSVEAAASEVSFVDVGVLRWTLLPGSRAVVRAVGAAGRGHVLALERGSLRAEVVPRAPEERPADVFAVEVGGTRVAVRGTLFTVTRLDDRVEVDVEHGTVAVGPAAPRGGAAEHLLVGPSRGTFSLDGDTAARHLPGPPPPESAATAAAAPPPSPPPPSPRAAAEVHAARPPSDDPAQPEIVDAAAEPAAPAVDAASAPPLPADPAPAPEAPAPQPSASPLPPALTPASVQASLASCFARETAGGSSSVRRSVVSTLRISVRSDGSVAGLRFNPPLRPALQACAEALYRGRFAGGPQQIDIPLTIED